MENVLLYAISPIVEHAKVKQSVSYVMEELFLQIVELLAFSIVELLVVLTVTVVQHVPAVIQVTPSILKELHVLSTVSKELISQPVDALIVQQLIAEDAIQPANAYAAKVYSI